MNRRLVRRIFPVLLLAGAIAAPAPAGAAAPPDTARAGPADVSRLFDYDASAPLDVQTTSREEIPALGAVVHDITFPSPVAGRVTANLVMPVAAAAGAVGATARPYAGIVFLHWGQGNRSEFIWEAALYARAGAVSITIDAPWARPEPWRQPGEGAMDQPEVLRKMYAQTVIDIRRAADVLLARGDVDPARLAFVGHSFGATWGGVLAGVDGRFRTCVLMGGLPTLADMDSTGLPEIDAYHRLIRRVLTPEQLQAYLDMVRPMAGINFVGRAAPNSVFMQFARFDAWISRKAAEQYFDAASQPKRIGWYLTSHEFTDPAALVERTQWLAAWIGIDRRALEAYLFTRPVPGVSHAR